MICKIVSRNIGILSRLRHFIPSHVLLLLYNSLILPHLSYGILLWGNTHKSSINRLFILQKRAVRLISNSLPRSPSQPLFKKLNLLTAPDLYFQNLGLFMFKYTQNLLPRVFETFF